MISGTNAMAAMGPRCGFPSRWTRRAAAVLALLVTGLFIDIRCQAQTLTDEQLRARFLLNFARFTDWPDRVFDSADTPLILCVLGAADSLDGTLQALEGAAAGMHRVAVRTGVTSDHVAECQMLFAPDNELGRLAPARQAIGGHAVLIVGESDAALALGAMIALRKEDRHLGFVVKVGAARDCDLKFSPQLLTAATEVLP